MSTNHAPLNLAAEAHVQKFEICIAVEGASTCLQRLPTQHHLMQYIYLRPPIDIHNQEGARDIAGHQKVGNIEVLILANGSLQAYSSAIHALPQMALL